jgi:hypothetical protein
VLPHTTCLQMFAASAEAFSFKQDGFTDLGSILDGLQAKQGRADNVLALMINKLVSEANAGNLKSAFVDPIVHQHASNLDKSVDKLMGNTFWVQRAIYGLAVTAGITITITGALLTAAFGIGLRGVDGQARAKWATPEAGTLDAAIGKVAKLFAPIDIRGNVEQALSKLDVLKDTVKSTAAVLQIPDI